MILRRYKEKREEVIRNAKEKEEVKKPVQKKTTKK